MWNGLSLDSAQCMHDTPTSSFLTERRGFACMYFKKYTMVLKGPGNATDLSVLQGKAYEKPF